MEANKEHFIESKEYLKGQVDTAKAILHRIKEV